MIFFTCLFVLLPFCYSQVFQTSPQNSVINETETSKFRCVPVENGSVIGIGWRVIFGGNARTINTGDIVAGIGNITVSGDRTNLTLANVSRSLNGGSIACLGFGDMDTITTFANITVQYRPEYTLVGTVPNPLDLGASVTVRFTVDGNPTPQNPILMKDGLPVPLNRTTPTVNELTIPNLQCDDAGQYTLQSSNAAGVGGGTFVLNITYTSPTTKANASIAFSSGESTSFRFADFVSGCPDNINITCTKGGMLVFTADGDVGENTLITLRRSQFVSTPNAGQTIINCTARNAVGSSTVVAVPVNYAEVPTVKSEKCAVGCIVGIVVGGLALVAIVVVGIIGTIYVCHRAKKRKQ